MPGPFHVAVLAVACGGGGNRPAPNPTMPSSIQICVPVTPSDAAVTINGQPVDASGCALVREDKNVVVEATLEGYAPYREEYPAAEGGKHILLQQTEEVSAP